MARKEQKSISELRRLYADILRGYSEFKHPILGCSAYMKHITSIEQAILDDKYHSVFTEAIEKGIPDEPTALKTACENGLWSEQKEDSLTLKKKEITSMRDTKKCLILPSQIEALDKQIKEFQEVIFSQIKERDTALGITAENIASASSNTEFLYTMVYKDRDLKIRFLGDEDNEALSHVELFLLTETYNDISNSLNDKSLQKIAVSAFFQSPFSLSEGNIYHFMGKPISQFSYYQTELCKYGKYFSQLLYGENRPPDDIIDNPDAIIDWYNAAQNSRNAIKDSINQGQNDPASGGGVGLTGATSEDLKKLGLENRVVNLAEEARRLGKTELTMEEIKAIKRR